MYVRSYMLGVLIYDTINTIIFKLNNELFRLLGYYAAYCVLKPTFWVYLSVKGQAVQGQRFSSTAAEDHDHVNTNA